MNAKHPYLVCHQTAVDNAINIIQIIQILPLYMVLPSFTHHFVFPVGLPHSTPYSLGSPLFPSHLTLTYAQMQVSCTSEIYTMCQLDQNQHDDWNTG